MKAEQDKYEPQQVQVDEQWISLENQPMIDTHLLVCAVCFGIPMSYYAECVRCGRIFCQQDYKQVVSNLDSCPNCKNTPFTKKQKPHILYTSVFDKITFQCKLCDPQDLVQQKYKNKNQNKNFIEEVQIISFQKERKTYTKQELSDHINEHHQKKQMDFTVLYDFQIEFQKGNDKIVFDMYQNMELNQKLSKFHSGKKRAAEFSYQLDTGDYLVINFDREIATSPTLRKAGRLLKKQSKTLKKGTQYEAWSVLLDIDFKLYSQKRQEQIIKEYQQFLKNPLKNQFTFDIGKQRYLLSFDKMVQINTYSRYERAIRKSIIKFT